MQRLFLGLLFALLLGACRPLEVKQFIALLPTSLNFEAVQTETLTTQSGEYESLNWTVCAGDAFRFRISSTETSSEVENSLYFWIEVATEPIVYYGKLQDSQSVYELPIQASGALHFRMLSPYQTLRVRLDHNIPAEKPSCGRPEVESPTIENEVSQAIEPEIPRNGIEMNMPSIPWDMLGMPAVEPLEINLHGRIIVYTVVTVELHWSAPVDLDLSSRWLEHSPLYSWRQSGEYFGNFFMGLEQDVNNVCYSASTQNIERFRWLIPYNERDMALQNVRFYIDFYDACQLAGQGIAMPYQLIYVVEERRGEEGDRHDETEEENLRYIDGGLCGILEGSRISFSLAQIMQSDSCENYRNHAPLPEY